MRVVRVEGTTLGGGGGLSGRLRDADAQQVEVMHEADRAVVLDDDQRGDLRALLDLERRGQQGVGRDGAGLAAS